MEKLPPSSTVKAPTSNFVGDVYRNSIRDPSPPSYLTAALVRFTPGARTNWHRHALGQTLHCTDGRGLVVTRDGTVITLTAGDTVWTPPDEDHWHGATTDCLMAHLALLEGIEGGGETTWLEPVTDEQYTEANEQSTQEDHHA